MTQPTSAPAQANIPQPAPTASPLLTQIKEGIKQTVVKGDFEIPTLPTVANEVMRLANDPKIGVPELEKIVKQDQAIAARVIKTANSPFYRGVQEITSLGNAMSRIGLKSVKDIVVSIGIQSKAFKLAGYEAVLDRIWNHSTACAGIAQIISKRMGLDSDQAFLAGLLHDIGKPIIVQVAGKLEDNERKRLQNEASKNFSKFDPKTFSIPGLKETALPQSFTEFHATVGAAVASRWNLSGPVIDVIKFHHDFTKAPEANKRLCMAVQAANMICHHAGLGHDETPLDLNAEPALDGLNLSQDQLEALVDSCVETAHKLMGFI